MKCEIIDSFSFWWKHRNDGTVLTRWMCRKLIKQRRRKELNPWLVDEEEKRDRRKAKKLINKK